MSVKTWMVLDDDPDMREIIQAMCVIWDIVPIVFKDGYEARDWLNEIKARGLADPPEVALLDIRLPGPNGITIARSIRSIPAFDVTLVVLMTAYKLSNSERMELIETATADLFIEKPLPSLGDFNRMIQQAIEKRRQQLLG